MLIIKHLEMGTALANIRSLMENIVIAPDAALIHNVRVACNAANVHAVNNMLATYVEACKLSPRNARAMQIAQEFARKLQIFVNTARMQAAH